MPTKYCKLDILYQKKYENGVKFLKYTYIYICK